MVEPRDDAREGRIEIDRARGALLGLAVGDALGTALEFRSPGSFEPVSDIVGGGPFGLEPGQWTDDTSMALCLAESLVETGRFDPRDQLRRYARWYREGHNSVTGRCFDIGNATRSALERFERTGETTAEATDPFSAGNGSIMRLAPVPIVFALEPAEAIRFSGESSRTTHALPECVDACRYLGGLIVGALHGVSKDELLAPRWTPVPGSWDEAPLHPAIDAVAAGSFLTKSPPAIRGSGYVVDTLEAALWAFASTSSFDEGALAVVNLGDDADTTGAVYGQIAGAYYGMSGIRPSWLDVLAWRDRLEGLIPALLSVRRGSVTRESGEGSGGSGG